MQIDYDRIAASICETMTKNSEYLRFRKHERPEWKTYEVIVEKKEHFNTLGRLVYHAGWRQYVFEPDSDTIYSLGCMQDIENTLRLLNLVQQMKSLGDAESVGEKFPKNGFCADCAGITDECSRGLGRCYKKKEGD